MVSRKRSQIEIVGHRSHDLGDPQSFNELRMIWTAILEAERGVRPPLRAEVKEKIVESLKATVEHRYATIKARALAASMLLAISEEDWERDVYRKPTHRNRRIRRTRR